MDPSDGDGEKVIHLQVVAILNSRWAWKQENNKTDI